MLQDHKFVSSKLKFSYILPFSLVPKTVTERYDLSVFLIILLVHPNSSRHDNVIQRNTIFFTWRTLLLLVLSPADLLRLSILL